MEEQILIKTFPRWITKNTGLDFPFSKRAFTLIETLIVLSLIALLFSYAATKIFSTKAKINDTFKTFTTLNRRLYTSAKMHKKKYRLSFQLKGRETTFWVEKENDKQEFEFAAIFLKKPKRLHPLLSLKFMESTYWDSEKATGLAFIYYHPKGAGQETALHFERRDRKGKWTLYFPPIKRELELINKDIPLNELTGG